MAYAINDINAVRMAFGPGIANVINGIGMGIVVVISMVKSINLKLALLTLSPVPVIIYLMLVIGKLVQKKI